MVHRGIYYLISAILVIGLSKCTIADREESIKPVIRDVTESVYASVEVRPSDLYQAYPERAGRIVSIDVKEGDSVQTGAIIAEIEVATILTNQLEQARILLRDAEQDLQGDNSLLATIELEIETARRSLEQDSINYARYERLWTQGVGKRVEYEQAQSQYESSADRLAALRKRYQQTQADLQNRYEQASQELETQQIQVGDYLVRSDRSGYIFALYKEVGEYIAVQEPIAEIGSADNYLLEMSVDEQDITRVEIGDTIAVILDAYNGEVFTGRLTRILPRKDKLTQTFTAEGVFIERPEQLYNGLDGEANIIVGRRKEALVIPAEYLVASNKVMTEDGALTVKVGVKTLDFVEIVEGVDTTTVLIKPVP